MISVQDLSRYYGNFHALKGISLEVNPGEIVGFLGPNGAGKTTTMRLITGSLAPSSGQVFFEGIPIEENRNFFKKQLGYLPESAPSYPEMRVIDYLRFVAHVRDLAGDPSVESVMDLCAIRHVAQRPIRDLSKGYRQRVGLAQALIHDPQVLILDEPSSGLDPNQIQEMMKLIQSFAGEKTVLFSSHILAEVEAVASRVIILNQGEIVADEQLDTLRHTLGGHQMMVKISGPPSESLAQTIKALPGIHSVEISQPNTEGVTTISLSTDTPDTSSSHVARIIIEGGWKLIELREQAPDLNQLFARLTGEKQ